MATLSPHAFAYPTSIIFTPTGETLSRGELSVNSYVPLNLRPRVEPAASWLGLQGGILPAFNYGQGFSFGGLEVGLDVINGATHPNDRAYAKPVLNIKASPLAETESHPLWPAIGIGVMNYAPSVRKESVNLSYAVLTKTLAVLGTDVGSITVGLGYAIAAKRFAFQGSPPFRDTHWAILGGYSTPLWHGFTLSLDTVGGTSELSSTNFAVSYEASDSVNLMLGAYVGNDRRLPRSEICDGVFASITVTWNPWDDSAQ